MTRTIVFVTALVMSLVFFTLVFSLHQQGQNQIIEEMTTLYSGKIQIVAKGYYSKINQYDIVNTSYYLTKMKGHQNKFDSVTRVTVPVSVNGPLQSALALMVGINLSEELKSSSQITNFFHEKENHHQNFKNGVFVSEYLLQTLGLKVGDKIPVSAMGVDGSLNQELMNINGALKLRQGKLAKVLIIVPKDYLQKFIVMNPNDYHMEIFFNENKINNIKNHYENQEIEVINWRKLMPDVSNTFIFMDVVTGFFSGILFLLVGLGLINGLSVLNYERRHEWRLLTIIGAQSQWIVKLVLGEILILFFISLIIGLPLCWSIITYFHHYPFDLEILSKGQSIMMNGVKINPKIKLTWDFVIFLKGSVCLILTLLLSIIPTLRNIYDSETKKRF